MIAFVTVHLWQSTLVLVAAWLLTFAFRRNAAAIRYWIWLGASVKFLVPLALLQWLGDHLGRSLPEPLPVTRRLVETANAIFVPALPAGDVLLQVQVFVVVVWIFGTAIALCRWFMQFETVRSMLTSVRRVDMGLPAPVCITPGNHAPGVFGAFRPVVILPAAVLQQLSAGQLQAVLSHEACHIRRYDNLTAAVHKCVEAIFWFHPLVWWIGANLLREREKACDESVVEEGHERRTYAESILSICRLGVEERLVSVASSTGGDLVERVSSIVSDRVVEPIGPGRFVLLVAVVMIVGYAPLGAGVVRGAISEESFSGGVTFDSITLKPSESGGRRGNTRFDADVSRLVLRNSSLREMLTSAYPWSTVSGDPRVIDGARYDIEAHWHGEGSASERHIYREVLRNILRTNFNVQVLVDNRCELRCE